MKIGKKALWVLGWLISFTAFAQSTDFEEGKHYQRLPVEMEENELVQELKKDSAKKIQVLEFFSYGCSWCYRLDDDVENWRKKNSSKVFFQRVPVEFQPAWGLLSKAYYTQLNLKVVDKIHSPLFEAIQSDKINPLSEKTLARFFEERGVKKEEFQRAFDSFEIKNQQKWANALSRALHITAIPALVVITPKGSFISSVRAAGSEEDLFKVVDHLIEQGAK